MLTKIDYKDIYLNILSILIIIYPISIVFSNFLTNFIVYFCAISMFALITYEKNFKIFKNKYFIIFILFCTYLTLRSLALRFNEITYIFDRHVYHFNDSLNVNYLISLKSSITLIRYLLFILTIKFLIENKENFLNLFTKIYLTFFLFIILDSYIQYFFNTNLFGMDSTNNRVSGLFGKDNLVIGSYTVRFMYLLIALILLIKINNYKIYISIILITGTLLTFLSGERASFALAILGLVFFCINTNIFKAKMIFLYSFVGIVFVFLLIQFNHKSMARFNQTTNDLKTADNIIYFSKGHESHYKTAIKMFKNNIFFGQGANTFRFVCGRKEFNSGIKSCSTHPHNIYIQLLAETGIVGLVFISYFFLIVFKIIIQNVLRIAKNDKNILSNYQICLINCLVINFWPIIPTGNFFSSFLGNMIIFSIAFLIINEKESLNEPN